MSKTPLTDAALIAVDVVRGAPVPYVTADFARKLETDRAELVEMVKRYLGTADIKTLEEALAITGIDDDARAILARLEADK